MARRVKVIVTAVAMSLAVAVGLASATTATDPGISKSSILIGGTFPLTGPAQLYGGIPAAEKAYFDWFNAHSSIHGRKINFKYLDDAYDPSETVPLTRQLVEQDRVFAIYGTLGTAPNLAIRTYLNQRKVPQVLIATGDSYWGYQYKQYPQTVGYNPDYIGEAKIYGQYVRAHFKNAKIGVLMQNDPYGKNYLQGLRLGLGNLKSHIVSVQPFDVTAPDVTQQMVALKGSGADLFFDFATPSPSIKALVTAVKIAWHPQIIVNNVSSSPAFMTIVEKLVGGAAIDGTISAGYLKTATDPSQANDPGVKLYKAIMAKYDPKGNILDDNLVYAMSSAWTMVYALQHAGNPPTRKGLIKALSHLNTAKDPFLLKGIALKTTPNDHFLIEQWKLVRWQGDRWHVFGKLYSHAR
jgi:branched-chain amino acid transport system substrate-binding protein